MDTYHYALFKKSGIRKLQDVFFVIHLVVDRHALAADRFNQVKMPLFHDQGQVT